MPYYTDLGLSGLPSSSAYSSLFVPGPYSNHSSIIASNFSHLKPLPRQYRAGYVPHLSTISELRRINSPKLLYHTSPKVNIRPIKKINTADIDVSVNKYRKYDKYEKPKADNIEKKCTDQTPSPKRSPRASTEDKEPREAKPNPIKRDRVTIRLQTVHRDTLQKEIGAIRSWRDNFKPEELAGNFEESTSTTKKIRKTPGEILKEKFLIRSRSKENMLKPESKKLSRKKSVRKSPSFHDICEAITSENIDVDLNPGQPEAVQRRQSRQISSEKVLKEIRRSSTTLSEDDLQIIDAILSEQNNLNQEPETKEEEAFKSRGSVRKKRFTKTKSNDNLNVDEGTSKSPSRITKSQSKEKVDAKSSLERRPTKKRLRVPSTDNGVQEEMNKSNSITEDIYKNVIRDISQVEIEQTAFKPKPVITGSGEIEETKPALKAVINGVEVKEAPTPKKEKKFRFNVIVEEMQDEEEQKSRASLKLQKPKILVDKFSLSNDNKGEVRFPKGKTPVISSILKKRPLSYSGQAMYQEEKSLKRGNLVNRNATGDSTEAGKEEVVNTVKINNKGDLLDRIERLEIDTNMKTELKAESKIEHKLEPAIQTRVENKSVAVVQRSISSSSSSKESSPSPASPIIKNKNFQILSKKDNTSEPNLFYEIAVSRQNSTSSDTTISSSNNSFNGKMKSPPPSPLAKVQSSDKMFASPPSSPIIKKQNIFSKGTTPPSSPVLKKENIFNKDISKLGDPRNVITKPEIVKPKEKVQPTNNDDSPSAVINIPEKVVTKRQETPPTSPTPKNQNLFNNKISENANHIVKDIKDEISLTQKDENDNTIDVCNTQQNELEKSESEKSVIEKKLISKRSLVQKANKDDPDLVVFIPPEPEPEPEPEPVEDKKDVFVPLQSNRLSQWMHPWKKPEQLDVCPVEIFARPKLIRGRHYPRPRGHAAPPPPNAQEDSSSEEEEETEDDSSSEEEETSEEESEEETATNKIGASTSSNDSGFGSGALGSNKDCDVNIHKKCEKLTANLCGVNQKLVVEAIESVRKGSSESRDSPTSNHANNPAFDLDSGDIPEEYSQSSTFTGFQKSGRITPPATTIPRFRKYCVEDFNFLKVLGKGSFGKVLLAELKGTEYYYAVKCLKKDVVLEDDDVECTLIERKVLALGTKHPYLCHLLCTFQTESHLFFVMEYLNGGDLMFHIQASGRFPEDRARFYGAEIVSGLKFLHNKGIVYRDLKLDNVLLDFDGHVRIADFGMCKLQIFLDRMAETFCGTPDYMAPEIIKGQHYNQCVDWWSFGVLLYEMLLGQSPFSGCDEDELFWSICNEKPVLPRCLSAEATNILTLFLEKDASKRLGNRFSPHGEIQDQPFFRSIDWYALEARKVESPFKPHLQHPLDTQYFDKHFTVEKAKLTPIDSAILQSMDQTQFQGFSYTNPNATDK